MGPPAGLRRPQQVHGSEVAIDGPGGLDRAEADAVVTAREGAWIGIVSADCVPILAASADGAAVAAIHAGWRGLAAGVVEAGIETLRASSDGRDLYAVIGPHIGPECYEVDGPVLSALRLRYGRQVVESAAKNTRPGHSQLDLGQIVAAALRAAGAQAARLEDSCTACDARRFHSFRRDGAAAGRLVHAISPRPLGR